MFDQKSRYSSIEQASFTLEDGTVVRYVKRRFLPQGGSLPLLAEVRTVQDDRLDSISYRTLGDPLAFWRVADANNAVNPFDLVSEVDVKIRIPVPM
jgi:hypothetical protein